MSGSVLLLSILVAPVRSLAPSPSVSPAARLSLGRPAGGRVRHLGFRHHSFTLAAAWRRSGALPALYYSCFLSFLVRARFLIQHVLRCIRSVLSAPLPPIGVRCCVLWARISRQMDIDGNYRPAPYTGATASFLLRSFHAHRRRVLSCTAAPLRRGAICFPAPETLLLGSVFARSIIA